VTLFRDNAAVKAAEKRRIGGVLARAPIAYLAVEVAGGPHVTPLLFAATPDRLWFGIGRGTLKARAIAKRPAVGIVVPGSEASVVVRGEAKLLDRLPASPGELARAPFALPAFTARNALEMAAFARDLTRTGGRAQRLAPVSVRADSIEFLDGWPGAAVLGWMAPDGPIALPARWDPRAERARVAAGPLKEAGGPRTSAASLCIDESEGRGPLAKRGRLLRGQGKARVRGETASVRLEVERVTRWKGFETTTVRTPRPSRARATARR
jgi:hypothetical protein